MTPAGNRTYGGDFVAWTGVCGFIGDGGGDAPIASHSHYAIQLAFAFPSGLRVQSGRDGEWHRCAGVLIPSRAPHSIDVQGCRMSTVLFIEPETATGKALAARLRGRVELLDEAVLESAAPRFETAWQIERSLAAVQVAGEQLLQRLSGTATREASDPRVLAAIDFVREHLDGRIVLADVARSAHLSPERFRHLFVEETGMPLRTYVLWRRLLRTWSLLMEGETLATAAHGAGFADAAHLSRTARTMFGLPPSVLQMRGPLSEQARGHQRAA